MTTELTTELITRTWQPVEVRLSPHGRRVAWSAAPYGNDDEHGESALWVASTEGESNGRRWTYGGSDTTPRWSPDGARLAFLSDRKERGIRGVYCLSAKGGEAQPIVVRERSVSTFAWSPDGSRIAFLAPDEPDDEDRRREEERDDPDVFGERWQRHHLHVVDVDSGETAVLLDADQHFGDLAWSPDGSQIALLAQVTPEPDERDRQSLWLCTVEDGAARRLCPTAGAGDLTWTADGSRVLYIAYQDGRSQAAYTAWSVATAPGSVPVRIGPGRSEPACSLGVRPHPDGRVAVMVAHGLTDALEWADPPDGDDTGEAEAEQAGREEAADIERTGDRAPLWDGGGEIGAFDIAGDQVAVVLGTAGRMPEVWVGAPGSLQPVSEHHRDWHDIRLGAVERFTWTASDGLELDGVTITPPGGVDGPNATVVLVHGGPYGRSGLSAHCRPLDWGQWLACAGYTVLMPNYRGGMGHGHEFASRVRQDVGGAEAQDVLAAVDAAVERGIADPERLGIGGWSQGGFLTAWAVTRTSRFKVGVMGAGVSDWGAMSAQSDLPTFESALVSDCPWDGPGPHDFARRSPISYAADCRTPLLILHGQNDIRVPISQATGFHRALRQQDTPVELVTYPREPHGIAEAKHQADVLRRVRHWLRQWLPVDPDGGGDREAD